MFTYLLILQKYNVIFTVLIIYSINMYLDYQVILFRILIRLLSKIYKFFLTSFYFLFLHYKISTLYALFT